MTYSRANPSPRYRSLIEMYRDLHENGEQQLGLPAAKTFDGMSLLAQAVRIKALIERTEANTLLDYGCGKGTLYELASFRAPDGNSYDGIVDYWDVAGVHCYDPCYAPYSKVPEGRFDGVISTDVLEHCPEPDVPWIIDEIFAYAEKFVYANIACYPAKKHLPNGENAHCTIRPVQWWESLLREASSRHPKLTWEVWVEFDEATSEGLKRRQQAIRA
jgi:hypothetical protein